MSDLKEQINRELLLFKLNVQGKQSGHGFEETTGAILQAFKQSLPKKERPNNKSSITKAYCDGRNDVITQVEKIIEGEKHE